MDALANVQVLYKPAAASWDQRQQLSAEQENGMFWMHPGDTLTVSRAPDRPSWSTRSFWTYFPSSYKAPSWQRARDMFKNNPQMDGVTLKKQPEGCYRLRFWFQAGVDLNAAAILHSLRSLAPVNAPVSASNGCPFYELHHSE